MRIWIHNTGYKIDESVWCTLPIDTFSDKYRKHIFLQVHLLRKHKDEDFRSVKEKFLKLGPTLAVDEPGPTVELNERLDLQDEISPENGLNVSSDDDSSEVPDEPAQDSPLSDGADNDDNDGNDEDDDSDVTDDDDDGEMSQETYNQLRSKKSLEI